MNKWLFSQAERIKNNFIEYSKFNLNKTVAEQLVNKGITIETLGKNENLAELFKVGMQYSPYIPLFKNVNNKPVLISNKFFEMIRLASSYSSFIKGLDQYVAAKKIEIAQQNQFIVFAYYSSIFHLITSFLSIHDHLFLPKIIQDVEVTTVEKRKRSEIVNFHSVWNKYIFAKYSEKENRWLFRYCGLNHNERWKLFSYILKKYLRNNWEDQIPDGVTEFWGHMKVQEEYPKHMYKDEWLYSIQFIDKNDYIRDLDHIYNIPTKIRHQKVYENRRWGLFSFAYLDKNEKPPKEIEDIEMTIFKSYCESMILWMYKIHIDVLNILEKDLPNSVFYKGLNGVTKNPYLQLNKYNIRELINEPIINTLNNKIPLLIELIFT